VCFPRPFRPFHNTIIRELYDTKNDTYSETKHNLILLQSRIKNTTDYLSENSENRLSTKYNIGLEFSLINNILIKEDIFRRQNILKEILTNPTHTSIIDLITPETLTTEII
jgi:hypothetical protein